MVMCAIPLLTVLIYVLVVVWIWRRSDGYNGLWIGLASNLCQVLIAASLVGVRGGIVSVRPMGHAALMGLVALIALAIGLPVSIWDLRKSATRLAGIAGVVLNVVALPVASLSLHGVAAVCGFTLGD